MKNWILEQWDWWIYRRAVNSLRRMCEHNQGFAYLFELQIREYRKAHPISKELERSTEVFHESLKRMSAKQLSPSDLSFLDNPGKETIS